MPQQQELFATHVEGRPAMTPDTGSASAKPVGPPAQRPRRTAGERFGIALMATEFLLAIMVRIFIGVIVLVLPWSPFWDNNHLLANYPHIARFLAYGATRGLLSGIGLLNLWVAVDETLHRSQRHL